MYLILKPTVSPVFQTQYAVCYQILHQGIGRLFLLLTPNLINSKIGQLSKFLDVFMHSKCSTKLMKVKFQEKEEIQIQENLTCAYSIHCSQEKVAKNCKILFPPSSSSFLPFTRLALWVKTRLVSFLAIVNATTRISS